MQHLRIQWPLGSLIFHSVHGTMPLCPVFSTASLAPMNRVLAFVLSVILVGCASTAQPPRVVSSLEWRQVGGITSYEQRFPGLGTSQRYESSAGWIDVYIYGLGRNDWTAGISDPQFAAHFESTVAEVRLYTQRGMYTNLQIGTFRDVPISGSVFRTIRFHFFRGGKPIASTTYLTAIGGQLLKYRVSIYATSGLDVDTVARSFIEENLRSGPSIRSRNTVLLSGAHEL